MSRSRRLQPVQRVSEAREQAAARSLGDAQRHLEQLRQQLKELEQYREEYRNHFHYSGRNGFSAQQMVQQQQFLAHIERALEQQHSAIDNAERQCEQRRQRWFKERGKSQALDRVVERYRDEERQVQERRAQKESDELAVRGGGMPKK